MKKKKKQRRRTEMNEKRTNGNKKKRGAREKKKKRDERCVDWEVEPVFTTIVTGRSQISPAYLSFFTISFPFFLSSTYSSSSLAFLRSLFFSPLFSSGSDMSTFPPYFSLFLVSLCKFFSISLYIFTLTRRSLPFSIFSSRCMSLPVHNLQLCSFILYKQYLCNTIYVSIYTLVSLCVALSCTRRRLVPSSICTVAQF